MLTAEKKNNSPQRLFISFITLYKNRSTAEHTTLRTINVRLQNRSFYTVYPKINYYVRCVK